MPAENEPLGAIDMVSRAKQLAKEDHVGWLCPDGMFVDVPETGGETSGLTLGRHEAGAIRLLESDYPDLMPDLDRRRNERNCKTWPETKRFNLIKAFMVERGFVRVVDDTLSMTDFD